MPIIESSILISRPVEAVFAHITNLDGQKGGAGGITEIVMNGPMAVGTHYITKGQVMGRAYSVENEIVAYEPGKKFGIKTLAAPPASPVTNTYTLSPEAGGTKLTIAMDTVITGGFPGVEDMVRNQLKSTQDQTLAALKKAIEG